MPAPDYSRQIDFAASLGINGEKLKNFNQNRSTVLLLWSLGLYSHVWIVSALMLKLGHKPCKINDEIPLHPLLNKRKSLIKI